MTPSEVAVTIRRGTAADEPAILDLLRDALGWRDARDPELFSWKHSNPAFGPSPFWVAVADEAVVGLRILMRWEFELGDRVVRAARAVDTATHSAFRRRGLFSRLATQALEELGAEGVEFVFNTPNQNSRPGYLRLGWEVVGRLPVAVRPTSLRAGLRIIRARVPAEQWSEASTAGVPAADVLNERDLVTGLLASRPRATRLRTRLSLEHLAWRYGPSFLGYRALADADGSGLAIFRVRRRGGAREAVLCDVLVPEDDHRLRRKMVRQVARAAGADYAIGMSPRAGADGLVLLPRQGPILTWRGLTSASMPRRREWQLTMGDIERL